ncbi:MAG: glutamine--fructose-6-phosphate transaminase (isomerizing), partial [Patescibacteria group bacterium]
MCGIVGYIGKQRAVPILIQGLHALEYRGYDSAGIFVLGSGVFKAVGEVSNLEKKIPKDILGTVGIAHTRWATHGRPSEANAHPHSDQSKTVWLVHNGIIENYKELKEHLIKKGSIFLSETDTEVLAHLVGSFYVKNVSLENAVTEALTHVRGTYGIAVVSVREPEKIIVARMGSPIVLGIGEKEYFVASDTSAILPHTKQVVYLNDGEYAILTKKEYFVYTLDHHKQERTPDRIEWNIGEAQKGGYAHFMLKEIMEAPDVLENSARGRLDMKNGTAKLGGLEGMEEKMASIKRIIIVGCGSAYYAGLVGKCLIEEFSGIPVDVEVASEFRYRNKHWNKKSVVLAVSQSGETADTLACIKEAKRNGVLTLGVVNVVGSTIARETDAGVYNHAGPEIGVASTKSFLSQIEVFALLALWLGRHRELSLSHGQEIVEALKSLPQKVKTVLLEHDAIKEIAKKYKDSENFLYIGRTWNLPIAYEGALKLKEISYIHAEGYGAGEMKHGPIAMIDKNFPTLAIVLKGAVYEKIISNIEEIKARSGRVVAIATTG